MCHPISQDAAPVRRARSAGEAATAGDPVHAVFSYQDEDGQWHEAPAPVAAPFTVASHGAAGGLPHGVLAVYQDDVAIGGPTHTPAFTAAAHGVALSALLDTGANRHALSLEAYNRLLLAGMPPWAPPGAHPEASLVSAAGGDVPVLRLGFLPAQVV